MVMPCFKEFAGNIEGNHEELHLGQSARSRIEYLRTIKNVNE
jgi:hypothetical protein